MPGPSKEKAYMGVGHLIWTLQILEGSGSFLEGLGESAGIFMQAFSLEGRGIKHLWIRDAKAELTESM